MQKRYDPATGGRKRNLLLTITSSGMLLSSGTPSGGTERWESYVSRYEKKLKGKMIKLIGLEALVAEEHAKHT